MLHLIKLAVGVRDIAHLRAVQAARAEANPPLRHKTRNQPRRKDELLDGGSIYWVIQGAIIARQLLRDVIEDTYEDGSTCAAIVLNPEIVQVEARLMKPFQGWRYLTAADAPPDLADVKHAAGTEEMPAKMRATLKELGLL